MAFIPLASVPLAPLTTLRVGGVAEQFAVIRDEDELVAAYAYAAQHALPVCVLGGGSNTLVADSGVGGLVIRVDVQGVVFDAAAEGVQVTAGAGVVFDELVSMCVSRSYWGLENLSAIPGTVGATPVQNVGAYGVEVCELISAVRAYDTETNSFVVFTADQCAFAYRDSRFKRESGRYVVTSVTYQLTHAPKPRLAYKDLAIWFADTPAPTLTEIRQAVVAIRSKKFPNLQVVGTAGSFFKNPVVTAGEGERLRLLYPELPLFPTADGRVKVAAGWLFEHVLKLKGVRDGNVGTFAGQALVIVTYEGATASEVDAFAKRISDDVLSLTGVAIEREVVSFGK